MSDLDPKDELGPPDLMSVFNEFDLSNLRSVSDDEPEDKSDFMSGSES